MVYNYSPESLIDNSRLVGRRSRELFIFVLLFVFLVGTASAYNVSKTNLQSGLDSISVSGASNAYSYEVNFTLDGTLTEIPAFDNFLKGGDDSVTTSNGNTLRGDNLFVYSSRLDNTKTGVTGSGRLFNISYTGTLTLTGAVFVNTAGESDHESYLSSTTPPGPTPPGGGGKKASIDTIETSSINIRASPEELFITSVYGELSKEEITIYNDGSKVLTLEIEFEGEAADYITADNTLNVGAGESSKFKMIIDGSNRGLVTGKMIIKVSGQKILEIPIILNVRSENFLFDSAITVLERFRFLSAGEPLKAQITLLQVGPKEKIDVTANYFIKDFSGRIYLDESETFFVLDEKSYAKDFLTEGLPPGKYVVGMEILYPGAFATTSSQFEIVSRAGFLIKYWPYLILGVVVAIGMLSLIWFLVRRRAYRKLSIT